jgi:hypothetical protein
MSTCNTVLAWAIPSANSGVAKQHRGDSRPSLESTGRPARLFLEAPVVTSNGRQRAGLISGDELILNTHRMSR